MNPPCELLTWDTDFFGIRIANVIVTEFDQTTFAVIDSWCVDNAIDCLYLLISGDNNAVKHQAQLNGYRLYDVRVTLENRNFAVYTVQENIREFVPSDLEHLRKIAGYSFTDSRFYADPCFDNEKADELYRVWISKECDGGAEQVFVAEDEGGTIQGFITCRLKHASGTISLVAVAENARGQSVGYKLVTHALHWFKEHNAQSVDVVTQGANVTAQRLYQRCGFLTKTVQFRYHKWYNFCTDE